MKPKTVEQITEILKDVGTAEELTAIEKVVGETKGKLPLQHPHGFWDGKTPCWEMCHCPELIKSECPAPNHTRLPCWAIEGTYCKLDDYGARGDDTSICEICRVYKRWGASQPVKIELFGRGINTQIRAIEELEERVRV